MGVLIGGGLVCLLALLGCAFVNWMEARYGAESPAVLPPFAGPRRPAPTTDAPGAGGDGVPPLQATHAGDRPAGYSGGRHEI